MATFFICCSKYALSVASEAILIGSIDSASTLFNDFIVGGHQQVKFTDTKFMGLHYAEKFLENFATGGLFFQNVLFNNFYLQYGGNALIYVDHIPLGDFVKPGLENTLDFHSMVGYGLEITYKSFIGPISYGMSSNTDDGYVRFYLSIGYSFNYSD